MSTSKQKETINEDAEAMHQRLAASLAMVLNHPECPEKFRADCCTSWRVPNLNGLCLDSHGLAGASANLPPFIIAAANFSFAVADGLDSADISEELWEELWEVAMNLLPPLIAPSGRRHEGMLLRGMTKEFLDAHATAGTLFQPPPEINSLVANQKA